VIDGACYGRADVAAEVWSPIRVCDSNGERTLCESERFSHALVPWLTLDVHDVFRDLDIPKE
jgi:hypothetical protein